MDSKYKRISNETFSKIICREPQQLWENLLPFIVDIDLHLLSLFPTKNFFLVRFLFLLILFKMGRIFTLQFLDLWMVNAKGSHMKPFQRSSCPIKINKFVLYNNLKMNWDQIKQWQPWDTRMPWGHSASGQMYNLCIWYWLYRIYYEFFTSKDLRLGTPHNASFWKSYQ